MAWPGIHRAQDAGEVGQGTTGFGSSVEDIEGSASGAHIKEGAMLIGISSAEEFKKIAEQFI